jgi:hypothetical protein
MIEQSTLLWMKGLLKLTHVVTEESDRLPCQRTIITFITALIFHEIKSIIFANCQLISNSSYILNPLHL